jgi:hypothetical protein
LIEEETYAKSHFNNRDCRMEFDRRRPRSSRAAAVVTVSVNRRRSHCEQTFVAMMQCEQDAS